MSFYDNVIDIIHRQLVDASLHGLLLVWWEFHIDSLKAFDGFQVVAEHFDFAAYPFLMGDRFLVLAIDICFGICEKQLPSM